MKKLFTLTLILLLSALAFVCCTNRPDSSDGLTPPEGWYFSARVIKIGGDRALVECTDSGTSGSVDVGLILYVNCTVTWEGYLHALPELNVNDEIRVVFDGRLMESDPPQVDAMEITVLGN